MKRRPERFGPICQIRIGAVRTGMLLIALSLLPGCSPEIGSEAWCRQMSEKSKRDWSVNDTANYATHCLLHRKDDG